MTYKEFKKLYSWMIRNYPNTTAFYADDMQAETIGTCTIDHYIKTGSRWNEVDSFTEDITKAYYCNGVDAVPFFRGIGGYERVETKYTRYGKIPFRVSSISPDRRQKTVRTYKFN